MTAINVTPIADTQQTCTIFEWCELDHSDPEITRFAPHSHEKWITLQAGDVSQRFLLEVVEGRPRIECSIDVQEVWREPGEGTDSFKNLSDVFATASTMYEQFVRALAASSHKGRTDEVQHVLR